jgi:hypothetical protein
MRIIGVMVGVLLSIAVGAAVVVGAHRALREPQSGWVVAVGGESFVVLDKQGAPAEVCTLDVGDTFCHPVTHLWDLRRHPVERWRTGPGDAPDLAAVPSAV